MYNAVPISAVQQSNPIIPIYTFFSHIILHHVLSQDIGYSSLCFPVGLHFLSILNVIVCIYQTSNSPSIPLPLGNHRSILRVSESVSFL